MVTEQQLTDYLPGIIYAEWLSHGHTGCRGNDLIIAFVVNKGGVGPDSTELVGNARDLAKVIDVK